MADRVTVSIDDAGIADVRLSRADKLNALDLEMFEALVATGHDLARNKVLRVVVVSGEGRAFSAGLDFASFVNMTGGERPRRSLLDREDESPANFAQEAAYAWTALPVPVIAAVHGVCFGGGLQIALGADVRFVHPDAKLSVMEIKWGLIPDMSGTQRLRHLLRQDVAKELTFTGRIVSGREAVEIGLATHLADDPHAAARAMAREISAKSPDAIRAAKRLVNEAYLGTEAAGLAREAEIQSTLIGTPNQVEAVQANIEKREASFQDPE